MRSQRTFSARKMVKRCFAIWQDFNFNFRRRQSGTHDEDQYLPYYTHPSPPDPGFTFNFALLTSSGANTHFRTRLFPPTCCLRRVWLVVVEFIWVSRWMRCGVLKENENPLARLWILENQNLKREARLLSLPSSSFFFVVLAQLLYQVYGG